MATNDTEDIRITEIMPKLFEGWSTVPFEECLQTHIGEFTKLKQSSTKTSGKYPVVDQGEEIVNGYVDDESLLFKGELPVIIFGDHTRRLKLIDFNFAVGADGTKILKPKPFLIFKFFFYYLKSLSIKSEGYSRHYKFLKSVNVPVPPLAEQQRIVAKLDELMEKIDRSRARLERIPKILKRFRQSVLAAAVSGKLTEEWRSKHIVEKDAEAFLLDIQYQRQHEYKIAVDLFKQNKGKKPRDVQNDFKPEYRMDDNYPDTWRITRIKDVSECLDYIRKPINKDERSKRLGSVPYYGANGQVGWIDDYLFDENLVVVVEDETFIGREIPFSYIITGKTWVNNHAHVLRPVGGMSVEYLNACLAFYDFIPLTSGTTGRRKLNQGALMEAELAIAPLKEQKEIVRKTDALFKLADKLELRYKTAKAQLEKFPQSLLAKAFRGELVSQNENDEPASMLLERIAVEKALLLGEKLTRYTFEESISMAAEPKDKIKHSKIKKKKSLST